jgi:uncharacterized repeat protein (TIGR03803 family)
MERPILTASHIAVATMYLGTTTVWTSSRNPGSIEHPRLRPAQASYTIVYRFFGGPKDGAVPTGRLIQGSDDMLYGTTPLGGAVGCGTVFRIAPDGSGFTLLHSFTGAPTDGASPADDLIQSADGTLYGTTETGGSLDRGTVFQMAPDGSDFTLLHNFLGGSGPTPPTRWSACFESPTALSTG